MRRCSTALIVFALALPAAALGAEPRASLPDIEDEVMCPICGTTLELSQAPQAERERELIRRLIADGRNKEQIKDTLVSEYGPDVLATPDSSGFDLSAWVVPAAGLLVVVGALGLAARRLARRRPRTSSSTAEPTEDERRRLEADLSAFDR